MKVAVLFFCLLLVACSGGSSQSLGGSLELRDPIRGGAIGDACQGTGGYADIRSGSTVTIKNQDGKIIATSSLSGGRSFKANNSDSFAYCRFSFMAEKVPEAKFYSVEIGQRKAITFSLDEMKRNEWKVVLTLG